MTELTPQIGKPSIAVKITKEGETDLRDKELLEKTMEQFGLMGRISGMEENSVEVYGYTADRHDPDEVRRLIVGVFPNTEVQVGTVEKVSEVDGKPVIGAVYGKE